MNDQDRTKQQLIEELARLRQAEAERRRIHDNLPVIVAMAGFDGYYKEVNAAFERATGWSKHELLSRSYFDFLHPDDRPRGQIELERLRSGEMLTNFIDRTLCKDGSYRWVAWVVIPVPGREVMFAIGQDITEQRQAEEALRASEDRYRQLADSTPDVIYILDETGKLLYANRVAGAYFGVNPESLVGKSQQDLFPPEQVQIHLERIQKVFETGHSGDREELYRFGDREVWLNVRTIPLRDDNGRITALMGICRDFTKRKLAEEALRKAHDELEEKVKERTAQLQQSCDELQAIYDGMVEGLLVTDVDTLRFLRVNASLCKMLGYSEVELLSLSLSDIHPPEAIPRILDNIRSTEDAVHTLPGNIPFLRKDGSIFYAEAIGALLIYDGKPCSMAIFRDITERLEAEAALRQSHDELQAIYDQALEGIVIADAETGNPIRANSAFCQLIGHTDESVHSITTETLHPPEVLPTALEYLDTVKKGGVARINDFPFLRKGGDTVYADVVSSSIRYNERPCWISFFHDVTERKQAQEALERERQSLWNMLQASDHERQTIAYDIHDGLAQYLAAADMQFQVHDSLKEKSPAEARKAYDTAVQLVRQAHAESRRLISEVRHPVIDERGLETAITSLAYEQRQRGGPRIECHTSVEFDRLPPILENALYRMAQEALTNACKHSKSSKVTVRLIQEGQEVRLEVQDEGTGFDAEAVGQDRFGLESIRQRVRLLGGRLTIESWPGSGTLVRAVVPIVERQEDG